MLLVSGCIAAHQRRASQVAMNGPMSSSGAISQTRHQASGWSWTESAAVAGEIGNFTDESPASERHNAAHRPARCSAILRT